MDDESGELMERAELTCIGKSRVQDGETSTRLSERSINFHAPMLARTVWTRLRCHIVNK